MLGLWLECVLGCLCSFGLRYFVVVTESNLWLVCIWGVFRFALSFDLGLNFLLAVMGFILC